MFSQYKNIEFDQLCHHCDEEVILTGYKEQLCPKCKEVLLPCGLCDAYTDNKNKVFAESCEYCPFSSNKDEQDKNREPNKDMAKSTFTKHTFILKEETEDNKPKIIPWSLKEINKDIKNTGLSISSVNVIYKERNIHRTDGSVISYPEGECLDSITMDVLEKTKFSDNPLIKTIGPINIDTENFTNYVLENPEYILYDLLNRVYDDKIYDRDRLDRSYVENLYIYYDLINEDLEDIGYIKELSQTFARISLKIDSLTTWRYNELLDEVDFYSIEFAAFLDYAWHDFQYYLDHYLTEFNYSDKIIMFSRKRKELFLCPRIYGLGSQQFQHEYFGVNLLTKEDKDNIINMTIMIAELCFRNCVIKFLYKNMSNITDCNKIIEHIIDQSELYFNKNKETYSLLEDLSDANEYIRHLKEQKRIYNLSNYIDDVV